MCLELVLAPCWPWTCSAGGAGGSGERNRRQTGKRGVTAELRSRAAETPGAGGGDVLAPGLLQRLPGSWGLTWKSTSHSSGEGRPLPAPAAAGLPVLTCGCEAQALPLPSPPWASPGPSLLLFSLVTARIVGFRAQPHRQLHQRSLTPHTCKDFSISRSGHIRGSWWT